MQEKCMRLVFAPLSITTNLLKTKTKKKTLQLQYNEEHHYFASR